MIQRSLADSRRELWKSAIVRANRGQAPEWLTPEFLGSLVEKETNGREIENIVRIAHALAREEHRDMTNEDLLRGLQALKQFDVDFSKWSEQKKAIKVPAGLLKGTSLQVTKE